eukprot:4952981-Pyramimonas_sp.AAC.1
MAGVTCLAAPVLAHPRALRGPIACCSPGPRRQRNTSTVLGSIQMQPVAADLCDFTSNAVASFSCARADRP